ADELARRCAEFPPERTQEETGIEPGEVRALARAFASAPSAAAYGRTGSGLGRFGTLVAYLLDALNVVTGNLDRPGGAVFGEPPIALDQIGEKVGLATYGKIRSRIGGYPDVIGNLPATLLPQEITTPGKGQIRAFFVSAGNPVLSVPDGGALEAALEQLDLMVSLDFYVNETNRHAHYVLPSTTFLERDDIPVAFLGLFNAPFIQVTKPVVAPSGEARQARGARQEGAPSRPQGASRRSGHRLRDRASRSRQRQQRRLPAATHRPARASLAQLLDAQFAAPDARRPHALASDPPRRRPCSGPRQRSRGTDRIRGREGRGARHADRRDDARHGRASTRLGPQGWRLAARERRGRRQLQPARALRSGG